MSGPDLRIVMRTRTTRRHQRPEFGKMLGLHEHARKSGMRDICSLRAQCEFGIRSQLDIPNAAPAVCERDTTDFAVRLTRREDIHAGRERSVVTGKLSV